MNQYDRQAIDMVMSDLRDPPDPRRRPEPRCEYDYCMSLENEEKMYKLFNGAYLHDLTQYDPANDSQHKLLHDHGIGDIVHRKPILFDSGDGLLSSNDMIDAIRFYEAAYHLKPLDVLVAVKRKDLPETFRMLKGLSRGQRGVVFLMHGHHWTSLSFGVEDNEKSLYYYFDPFGTPPCPEIYHWLCRRNNWDYSDRTFQRGATQCGMHCIVQALQLRAGSDRRMQRYRSFFFRAPSEEHRRLGEALAAIPDVIDEVEAKKLDAVENLRLLARGDLRLKWERFPEVDASASLLDLTRYFTTFVGASHSPTAFNDG